jgi:hypothetical protein
MSADISKIDVIFHPTHLPMKSPPSEGKLLQALDNKISFFALKAIRNISVVLLSATLFSLAVGSVAFWPATLTIGVLAISAFGIHLLLNQSKCYYNPCKLQEHKKEATSLVLTYRYLDKHAQMNESIKKDILHPIKALFSKHSNIEKFFKYEIIDAETFKEALILELNYSEFDEALSLLNMLKTKTKKEKFREVIDNCASILKDKFEKLIRNKQTDYETIAESTKEDFRDFYTFKKDLKIFIKQLERACSSSIIEGDKIPLLDQINLLKKHLEKFEKNSKKTDSAHQKWDKELDQIDQELNAAYASLSQHYQLSVAKKDFICQLNEIQKSSERKKKEITESLQIFLEGLEHFEDDEKKDLETFYKAKLNQEFASIDEKTKFHIETLATRVASEEIYELTKQTIQASKEKDENHQRLKAKVNKKYEAALLNKTTYCDFSEQIEIIYDQAGALLDTALNAIKMSPEQ